MKKKLTFSQRRKLRKLIRANQTAETTFLRSLFSVFDKQVFNKISASTSVFDIEKMLMNVEIDSFDKLIKRLDKDVLKKNRKGYEGVVDALVRGMQQQKEAEREDKRFRKAMLALTKEKEIYEPLMQKFNENMSKIKDLPYDIITELRKSYLRGEGLRHTEAERLIREKLENRAKLIVRTESAKLNAALTEVRAKAMGLNGYQWSTSGDQRVRQSHKMVDGVLFFWDSPPTLDGIKGNPGEFYNCRCVSLPIFSFEEIHFPVKVGENLVIESKWNKQTHKEEAKIKSGSITTYTKDEFLRKFSI